MRSQSARVALLHQGVVSQVGIVCAQALRHRRMFLGHEVLAHLNDGLHLAAHVADRIEPALVLYGAGHLAARPPHQDRWRAGIINGASPGAHVGFDVDTCPGDRE